MSDKTSTGVNVDRVANRKRRHNEQNLRNLLHQVENMRDFNIPNKEDELADMREELAANEARVCELQKVLALESTDG